DAAGNLYGTTTSGGNFGHCGTDGCGTVFKLTPSGTETLLYRFLGTPDASYPYGLVRDAAGNLYGTTLGGGAYGFGAVFKVTPSGEETVLHSFNLPPDGFIPVGVLVLDAAGNLYGTTTGGGFYGLGTVFKLTPSGKETILYSFAG